MDLRFRQLAIGTYDRASLYGVLDSQALAELVARRRMSRSHLRLAVAA
jgi:hypothetical protein